jgi:predicted TIM-barrel fold metal-dependent hydrolase
LRAYEAKSVRHLVVAPEGRYTEAARREVSRFQDAGLNMDLITYPARLDDEIVRMGSQAMLAARRFLGG